MIRFGIAGVGRHGLRYAHHLHRGDIPGATVTAVWRRDPEAGRDIAETVGAKYHPTLDDLLSDDTVDAVIMAVPCGRHRELASRVAAAARPLLLEKPIAPTTAEAEEIATAFRRAQRPLTIAHTLRFDPLVSAARQESEERGPLVGFGFEQRIEPRNLAWEDDPILSGGGVLSQTGIHAVDAVRVLIRPTRATVISCSTAQLHYRRQEDAAVVLLSVTGGLARKNDGILGDIRVSKIGDSRHHRYALFYEDGGVELDFIDRELVLTQGRTRTRTTVEATPTIPAVVRAFIEHLAGAGPNPVPAEEAIGSLALVEAAYAHAAGRHRTGRSSTTAPPSLIR